MRLKRYINEGANFNAITKSAEGIALIIGANYQFYVGSMNKIENGINKKMGDFIKKTPPYKFFGKYRDRTLKLMIKTVFAGVSPKINKALKDLFKSIDTEKIQGFADDTKFEYLVRGFFRGMGLALDVTFENFIKGFALFCLFDLFIGIIYPIIQVSMPEVVSYGLIVTIIGPFMEEFFRHIALKMKGGSAGYLLVFNLAEGLQYATMFKNIIAGGVLRSFVQLNHYWFAGIQQYAIDKGEDAKGFQYAWITHCLHNSIFAGINPINILGGAVATAAVVATGGDAETALDIIEPDIWA